MIEFYISHRNPKKQIKEAVPGNMIFRDFFEKKSLYDVQNRIIRQELFFQQQESEHFEIRSNRKENT